jgi:hypothetical protein
MRCNDAALLLLLLLLLLLASFDCRCQDLHLLQALLEQLLCTQ